MCPKAKRDRGNHTVVGISPILPKRSDYPKYLIFLRSVFNHSSGAHLILHPFGIIEYALIMSVYGITKHYFKDIQDAIELLTQLYVMPIKGQCFSCITAASNQIFIEASSGKRLFVLRVFHFGIFNVLLFAK